jgi:condensin-2 complex subunit G2
LVEGCCRPPKGFEEWATALAKSSNNIGEVFEGLSSKQRTQLFSGLLTQAQSVLGTTHASLLNSIAWTYSKLLPCLPRSLPSQATEALAHLAKHLMPFFCEDHAPVLDAALHIMETWWLEDRDGKLDLAQSTVEGLIYLCFSSHGKPKDVRRLLNVQDALVCCGASTHIAVQKCLEHPMFTLSSDGRKFLSFAASVSVPLASAFASSILQQLPSARKSLLDAFGQIMFGAWHTGDADIRSCIELNFVQELSHRICLVASESVAVAGRRVLRAWHHSKDVPTVDETLLRLYEPFIWRLLAAANARVRRNTVT